MNGQNEPVQLILEDLFLVMKNKKMDYTHILLYNFHPVLHRQYRRFLLYRGILSNLPDYQVLKMQRN